MDIKKATIIIDQVIEARSDGIESMAWKTIKSNLHFLQQPLSDSRGGMLKVPKILYKAQRQYRHNTGDDTLVRGFDFEETIKIVNDLLEHSDNSKYKELRDQVVWAVTHYGIVDTDGISEILRDIVLKLDTSDNSE